MAAKKRLPRWDDRRGWIGGDSRTLYAFVDRRTGNVFVQPGGGAGKKLLGGVGPEATVRVASRAEAEQHWQSPLHAGWTVHHSTKKHSTRKQPRGHMTRRGPSAADIAREAARAQSATPRARVTAYARGPYVDEKHINVTTTVGDLAGSHSAAHRAIRKAGITPSRVWAGTIRLTVDDDLPLAQAKMIVVTALKEAGIKVDA